MDLEISKVRARGHECDAVKVTAYNAFDVAKWCGGTLTRMHVQPGEPIAVEIDVPESPGYAVAKIDDYIVRTEYGAFGVYAPSVFKKAFSYVAQSGEKSAGDGTEGTEGPETLRNVAEGERTSVLFRLGAILFAWAKGESAKQGDVLALPLDWRRVACAVDARIVSSTMAAPVSPSPSPAVTEARGDGVHTSSVASVLADARRWRYVRERLCIVREREARRFGAPSQVLTKVRLRFPYISLPYALHDTHTPEELDWEIDKAVMLDAGR